MSRVTTDKFGRTRIALDETHNTPGYVEVEGDVYDGPVACISFRLSADRIVTDGEIDFGTFRVGMPTGETAWVTGNVILGADDVRTLAAALLAMIEAEA